jgi:hypothetical protein
VTPRAKGLAKVIFGKFPWSDNYARRKGSPSNPGTIEINGNGMDQRFVINMFAQYTPGKPSRKESQAQRLEYFRSCLAAVKAIPDLGSVAFPFNIGCGMAGGKWDDYKRELNMFANDVRVPVVLYRFKA